MADTITLRSAIDRTMLRITQTAGADVQVYGEQTLVEMLWSRYTNLFDKFWWPQFYNPGTVYTLDGVSGSVTADLSSVISTHRDIRFVWKDGFEQPLPMVHHRINPTLVKRTCFQFVNNPTKVFRILPATTTGDVIVAYRSRPAPPGSNDTYVFQMDDQLLILGAGYDFLNEIGINPAAEDKFARWYEDRYQMITKNIEKYETSTESIVDNIPLSGWQEF